MFLPLLQLYLLHFEMGSFLAKALRWCQVQLTWPFGDTQSQIMHSSASASSYDKGSPLNKPALRQFVRLLLASKDELELVTPSLSFSFILDWGFFYLLKHSNSSKLLKIPYFFMKIKLFFSWQEKKKYPLGIFY